MITDAMAMITTIACEAIAVAIGLAIVTSVIVSIYTRHTCALARALNVFSGSSGPHTYLLWKTPNRNLKK